MLQQRGHANNGFSGFSLCFRVGPLLSISFEGEVFMHDLFGRVFYEWWGGLPRVARIVTALVILGLAGVAAWVFPEGWLLWEPALAAGAVLLLVG